MNENDDEMEEFMGMKGVAHFHDILIDTSYLALPSRADVMTDDASKYFVYDEMETLRSSLDEKKEAIEGFPKWRRAADTAELLRPLKADLANEFRLRGVTNAWLKIIEIYQHFDLLRGPKHTTPLRIAFLAELPGAFIAATKFLIGKQNNMGFEWFAQSLISGDDSKYLGDQYGFLKNEPERWDFGPTRTGDITDPDNLRYYAAEYGPGGHKWTEGADIVTADGAIGVEQDALWNWQEEINLKVFLGEIIGAITILRPGGTAIIKMYTLFHPGSVALIYIMGLCFEEIHIVKPQASRPANSETYLVGKGMQRSDIHEILNDFIAEWQIDVKSGITRYDDIRSPLSDKFIPTDFAGQIVDVMTDFTGEQIYHLSRIELLARFTARKRPQKIYSKVMRKIETDSKAAVTRWRKNNEI